MDLVTLLQVLTHTVTNGSLMYCTSMDLVTLLQVLTHTAANGSLMYCTSMDLVTLFQVLTHTAANGSLSQEFSGQYTLWPAHNTTAEPIFQTPFLFSIAVCFFAIEYYKEIDFVVMNTTTFSRLQCLNG